MPSKEDSSSNKEIDVVQIVDSIKKRIYIEDDDFFEKRMKHIEEAIENYDLPDLGKDFAIFRVWPFRWFGSVVTKVFRKLHYRQTKRYREAMHLMMDELRTMKLILKDVSDSVYPKASNKGEDENQS